MELRLVRPSHVQAWIKGLSQTLAPATVAVVHGIVASVFKAAMRDRRITTSPCVGTKLPEGHREAVVPLETEAVAALRAALPERYRALVTLAAATGLRQGEAFGLTVDRSGLRPPSSKPVLRVDRQILLLPKEAPYLGPPKRKASRRDIPLPRVAVEALAAHLAAFPLTPQPIVCRDVANRITTETVELVFTNDAGKPIRRSNVASGRQGFGGSSGHDVSRSASLLRLTADPARGVGEGCTGAPGARDGGRGAGHLRPPVAGLGGSYEGCGGLRSRLA